MTRKKSTRNPSGRSSIYLGKDGYWRQKADPMAFGTEVPPATASDVVESTYEW